MKITIKTLSLIIIIFVITTIIVSLSILNGNHYLKNFNIISVNNIATTYNLKFEKVKSAKYYEIIVYSNDNSVFYEEKTTNNNVSLNLSNIINNNEYKIVILAYDENGNNITVNNPYSFRYMEPTFNPNNSLLLTDFIDYTLKIDGDLSKKDYYLEINDGLYTIIKEKIKTNEYTIPYKLYTGINQIFYLNLYDNNNIINSLVLYSNISPVQDIKIESPKNNEIMDYKDIVLEYSGGQNSTSKVLEIYTNDTLIKEIPVINNKVIISKDFFKKGKPYKVIIKAIYNDIDKYTKIDKVDFTINDKDTLKPAYINSISSYNNNYIELYNPNNKGDIYYTIDGTDPSNGLIYKDKILINDNTILKTIIKEKNSNNSIIKEYPISNNLKDTYKIYLNIGNNKALKEISDNISKKLKDNNIIVYQNDLNSTYNELISESKTLNTDLYLSINFNESTSHELYGLETWINNEESISYSLANIIHNNLISIYYNKEGNRGIKYASNSLDELSSKNVNNSILINLIFSDNEEDTKWFNSNKDKIVDTITNSILKYFGII